MNSRQSTSSNIPVVNIVSYSYKGGSGRSTASVNIAFELARRGNLVVCLDMDVGAAGLHMILSEWHEKARDHIRKNDGKIGHQAFFNLKNPSPDDLAMLDPAILDIRGVGLGSYILSGELLFVFSSTAKRAIRDVSGDLDSSKAFEQKYRALQQFLAAEIGGTGEREVYFIVDAPNGITPVSLPLLKCSDLILMFYRHSLQHIHGTIEAGRKLHHYLSDEIDRRYMRILLVGSCVPERMIDSLGSAHKSTDIGEYGIDMLNKFNGMQRDLISFAEKYPNVVRWLDHSIIEDDVLKVLEQPLTMNGVKNEYLGYSYDAAHVWSSERTRDKIGEISKTIAEYGPEIARRKNRMYGY